MGYDPTSKNYNKLRDGADGRLTDDVVITRLHAGRHCCNSAAKSGFRVGTDAMFLAAGVGVNRGRSGSGRRGWWG